MNAAPMACWRGLGLAVAIAACPTGNAASASGIAAPARTVRAAAGDLFRMADEFARRGQHRRAESIYKALAADPRPDVRIEARFRHSRLLQARGQYARAALLLRQILDDKPDATTVRLELAQLLDRMGDKEAALREVRAAQSAGLPDAVARLVDRYSEALRAARPMGASFQVAIAPDNNINRSTRSDTLGTVIGDFDIDEDSKAKSGVGVSLSGQAYRRLALGNDLSLLGRAGGLADLYRTSRFNDVALDLAVGPELTAGRDRFALEAGVTQRWFGQERLARSVRLGASWTKAIGRRSQLRLGAETASIDHRLNDLQDGRSYAGHASFEHALSPSTGVALTLGADRQALADPGYSTRSWRAGLLGWRNLGRTTVTAEVQVGRLRADERLSLFPDKRRERSTRIRLGATFRQLTVGGFAPTARLVIERNQSSIEFYDYTRRRTEFGVVRAF